MFHLESTSVMLRDTLLGDLRFKISDRITFCPLQPDPIPTFRIKLMSNGFSQKYANYL